MRNLTSNLNKLTYSLMLSGHKTIPPNWSRTNSRPKYHSIWFITKGYGEVTLNGKKHTLSPGKLIVFTPDMICDKKANRTTSLEFYFVRFSYALAFEEKEKWNFKQSEEIAFPLRGVYSINNNSAVVSILEELNALSKRRGVTVSFQQKLLFQQLLLIFIEDSQSVFSNFTIFES